MLAISSEYRSQTGWGGGEGGREFGSNLLNEGVDTAENYTADYAERAIRSIQNSLNTGRLSDGKPVTPAMRQTLLKRLEKYQQEAQERPEGTFEERHPTLSGAQETLYNAADEIGALSQRNIAEAKEGLGSVGQFAVDVGVAGTQLAGLGGGLSPRLLLCTPESAFHHP